MKNPTSAAAEPWTPSPQKKICREELKEELLQTSASELI